jgi:GxxExxY protein
MERSNQQLTFEIIQAAKAVHEVLGPGFVEPIYNKAFIVELRHRGLIVEREKLIRIVYASVIVGKHYLDLVVEDRVIIELKAARAIVPVFDAQMRSYLTASPYSFGVIINFGEKELEWKEVS